MIVRKISEILGIPQSGVWAFLFLQSLHFVRFCMTVGCYHISAVLLWSPFITLAQKRQPAHNVNQTALPANCVSVMILI